MIFFASASANQNDLVEKEAREAGAQDIKVSSGGVEFSADLETAYRFCMWTRSATRLLVLVHRDDSMASTDDLFDHSMSLPWENWVNPDKTFAITETVTDCRWIRNSHFASLRLKDAIVERIRGAYNGARPSIDRENPDIVFHLHVNRNLVSWYVDFAGRDLSHRGYRTAQTQAIMSEFMAASLLYRSDWYRKLRASFEDPSLEAPALLDPFCGSGTVCIEAALMVTNTAPGLLKLDDFAFHKLPIHKEEIWEKIVDEAESKVCENRCKIVGWDIDKRAIEISKANAKEAGVENLVSFEVKDFTTISEQDVPAQSGCIVTDPPYGVRLDSGSAAIRRLYTAMGEVIFNIFCGWSITILCGNSELLGFIDMKPSRTNILINGGIECQAAHYYVFSKAERQAMLEKAQAKREERLSQPLSPGAQMAANRLNKNIASIGKAMAKQGVTCYRLYDADMPEYSAAIDVYEGKWISLQEYAAPSSIDPEDAKRRLEELVLATERTTGIDYDNIYVKRREIQKGANQYIKRGNSSHFYIVNENGHKFLVNFADYLDTGIFLDHRPVRKLIETMSKDKRFLNLFCYTGSATVHAAAGGALSTVSVDANANYLEWATKNMQINNLNTMNHFFYKDDCLSFLRENRDVFDLIFCDPPTFSNSKGRDTFDVQRDHGYLIRSCMKHLAHDGVLIFSTNFTRFKLFGELYEDFIIEDITESTIGEDFARNSKIHRCYMIRHKTEQALAIEPTKKIVKRIVKKG
ncbi:MAG: bifunctional 23S rRNA (guanine(2069)-N(7))-methyltransferase RlmK/23S rRNA (guanine(2445)-N(2))-methyltransferase RlmL [Sphaerochaetaceae bacterium]|nr:bifunctional 23S rRNA (guanine(2069)-N(7))-methyltransferase RlmK/23S rRNA (guanine(2445)-N(2))-methyltransferase RlmL [Sphaerochaetaceae bacterium]